MNKLKLFIDNFLVYGFGGIISNLIPFIMIPIVTRIMPSTEYYGISDLSNTIVQFGSAIAVMGMYDAMYRMFFEKEDEIFRRTVCSTALSFTLITSFVVFVVMVLFKDSIAHLFLSDTQYSYVIYFSAMTTLIGATNCIISAPTRMQNKRKVFLVTNTISPMISYAISIPLLLAGQYIIALPLAAAISGLTIEIVFGVLNIKWFNPKLFNRDLFKQMLAIALPLFPNFIIYWIFNSCDKVMITNILGIGEAGVYSVGSKLGQASQLIYIAFAGGWQFFAFSTMKEKKQIESNSKVFEYLGVISYVVTAFICAFSFFVIDLLFEPEYLSAYIVAPYLFMAPLLQMLFQIASNQFLVVKKTWPNIFILASGAIMNVIFNLFLIPVLGIEGAALATLSGYVVSDVICVVVLCHMKLMVISKRFVFSTMVMAAVFVIWRFLVLDSILGGIVLALISSIVLVALYLHDIRSFFKTLFKNKQNVESNV